jgi:hypothetical protein
MTKSKETKRIPKFKTLEEEAAFWDTHSPLEFEDEWVEVKRINVARPLRHFFELELDAKLLTRLTALSRKRELSLSELLRGWIEERLTAEEARETESAEPRPDASSS